EKELQAYAKELDNIHTRLAGVAAVGARGGVEQVGGSVLGAVKSRYRSGMASEFYFQPGPHSRTVRVLHWATGQRMRGVIATDDAVRGHDELMDTLVRSKLFTADQRKAVSEKWWTAPDQAARSNMVQALPEVILNKLASKHFEGDRKLLDETIQSYRGWSEAARTYTTKQMEKARSEDLNRVVLEDPLTGTPTSIDRALFETHIENNVAIPDVALLERMVRHAKDGGTLSDKVKKSGEWALKSAENANDLWRTMTLARPGFVVRTQLDTQARVAMTVGASSIVRNAMAGLGHKIGDKLSGEQVVKVEALASDLLRQETLRREAAGLRAKADLVDSGYGAARVDVADITPDPREAMYPGGTPMFHGTSQRFPGDAVNPDPYGGSGSENLFGYGFYTTGDRGVANSYTAKGRGGVPVVYQVKWNGEAAPRVLDLETSRDPEIRKFVRGIVASDAESASLLSGAGSRSAGSDEMLKLLDDPAVKDSKVLLALRRYLAEGGETPSSVADEIYMDLADILSSRYDAIAHTGGLYAGKGAGIKHQVKIWLDPSKVSVTAHSERTGKRIERGAKAGSNSAAQRLHERADALEAEAAKVVTYDATARRLITQDKTLNIRGQKVTTRAAASDAEAQALVPALHTGDMTIGDAITQIQGKYQMQYAENANSWVTTMPEDRT
ncbi:MAG TPA: hypothetical protein VK204_07980, partial [Nocardioidaceae bacterium]|nr:hypothetical protein [Nocardioidaceae bacterium]